MRRLRGTLAGFIAGSCGALALVLFGCVGDDAGTVVVVRADGSPSDDAATGGDGGGGGGGDGAAEAATPCLAPKTTCGSACVDPQSDPKHCGGCDKPCGVGACSAGECPARIVFVTLTEFSAALGGADGADVKCQAAADAAKLPGRYKAWVSTSDVGKSVIDRFEKSPYPYKLPGGTVIATSWGALTSADLQRPINVTEFDSGLPIGQSLRAWTQTTSAGAFNPNGDACNKFTSTSDAGAACYAGDVRETTNDWSEGPAYGCELQARLFCFEQR